MSQPYQPGPLLLGLCGSSERLFVLLQTALITSLEARWYHGEYTHCSFYRGVYARLAVLFTELSLFENSSIEDEIGIPIMDGGVGVYPDIRGHVPFLLDCPRRLTVTVGVMTILIVPSTTRSGVPANCVTNGN